MEAVFAGQERLLPRQSDLSFYNWNTRRIFSNASTYFEVRPLLHGCTRARTLTVQVCRSWVIIEVIWTCQMKPNAGYCPVQHTGMGPGAYRGLRSQA